MARPYTLPVVGPLFEPLPYRYRNVRKVSVFCACDPEALARFLPDEFALVGDVCEIFAMETPDAGPLGRYNEGGVVIPVKYGDEVGGHVALEYVETDDSLAAGREIWGYPKKLAEVPISFGEDGSVEAVIRRRGVDIVAIDFQPGDAAFEKPVLQPRYQIKTFPSADGSSAGTYEVIRNEVTGFVLHGRQPGKATVRLASSRQDPLAELGMRAVVGAELSTYDFDLGYGEIVSTRGAG